MSRPVWSILSARMRRARASTRDLASASVWPYARAPGISSMQAAVGFGVELDREVYIYAWRIHWRRGGREGLCARGRMLGGMDPVTHMLTGACLARTGLNRKAAYATVTMALAAEMPDLDVIWGAWGPVAGFQHHRGWTHTLLGLPVEAAVLVGAVWGCLRIWRWRRRGANATTTTGIRHPAQEDGQKLATAKATTTTGVVRLAQDDGEKLATGNANAMANVTAKVNTRGGAPEKWGLLFGFALLALLSHLLLDWTNNYGVRLLAPFYPRWFAGSFVFIVEPLLLLLLGGWVAGARAVWTGGRRGRGTAGAVPWAGMGVGGAAGGGGAVGGAMVGAWAGAAGGGGG